MPLPRTRRTLIGLMLTVLLTGCGGGVKIAGTATRQASHVVGGQAQESLVMSSDDVSRLASEAGVGDDAIRDVAPQLDAQPLWKRSLTEVGDVYRQTPEVIRSNLTGLACEGVTGGISSTDELWSKILDRFQGATQSEAEQYYHSVFELWEALHEAYSSNDPQLRATAVLTCYTVENVG